jgi:SpoVK/Ycf46/Vps4 family AAA+-type ATPase
MSSLFESICQLAERHAKSPTHSDRAFLVILIDEVESIAACRRKAAARGEVHEAVRATNALLTGLDRVMGMANVLVLATSNLYDAIDAAFIDRCGLVETIGLPDARSRYNILFRAIRGLVERGVVREGVHTLGRWPRYDMAAYGSEVGYLKPEQMLRRIADRFDDPELVHHPQISGRMLAALPGTILATGGNLAEDNRVDVSELVARMSQHLRKAYPKRTVPDGVDAAMGSGGTGSADRNRDGHGSENGEVRNMNGKRTFERPLEGDDIDVLYYEFRKRVVREFGLVPTDLRNMSGRDAI